MQKFQEKFDATPEFEVVVPSRINLIGEHSDYFENFVLSMAAGNFHMRSLVRPRNDQKVRMFSVNLDRKNVELTQNHRSMEEFSVLDDRIKDQWVQYVQGAIAMYAEEYTRRKLKSFDLLIDSSIPVGGGLSSSSALTMTALIALGISNGFTDGEKDYTAEEGIGMINKKADDESSKKLLQKIFMMGCWTEYWYGTRGGFNDHLAMTVGKKGFASLSDNRHKTYEYVPIPEGLAFVVCNTMVRHNQLYSEYDVRKNDAWRALAKLEKYSPNAKNVRDIDRKLLEDHKEDLTDLEYRRLLHPITEKDRVFGFVEAFKNSDFKKAGELLSGTHDSLRDNYEVSCAELDIMQEAALESPGCFGARLVGGGFGGCVVALVDENKVDEFIGFVKSKYDENSKIKAQKIDSEIWEAESGEGIQIKSLESVKV